jgi:hypothetical protein
MNTRHRIRVAPIDSHAAIARAHANRAKHLGFALAQASVLFKRLAAQLRPGRPHLPHTGTWA